METQSEEDPPARLSPGEERNMEFLQGPRDSPPPEWARIPKVFSIAFQTALEQGAVGLQSPPSGKAPGTEVIVPVLHGIWRIEGNV